MTASTPELTTISLPEPNADLVTLICRVCDGEATHADLDRLEQLLTDPAAVTLYLALCELDASLLWKHRWQHPWQPPASAAADCSASLTQGGSWLDSFADQLATIIGTVLIGLGRRLASRTGIAVLLAAGIGLGVAGAWRVGLLERPTQWLITRLHQARFPRAPGSIACVTGLHDVVWEAADQAELPAGAQAGAEAAAPLSLYDSLFGGQHVSLSRGLVELCFDSGATVLLEGPAVFKLDSDRRGHLEQGRLTATLQDTPSATADPRFSVTTPTAIVHDLGTSFGVAVDATGETEVSVFSGLVDLLPHLAAAPSEPPSRPLRLMAGEAARVATSQPPIRQPATVTYARTLPGQPVPQLPVLPFNWQEGAAVTIYEDAMSGAGRLAGSSPAAHAGKGEANWMAPSAGWQRNPDGGLTVTQVGAALLPFKPERGYLYRIRLTIPPPQRQTAEVSFGFTTTVDPARPVLAFPWAAASGGDPPLVTATPVQTGQADRTTRSVILDTSQAEWRLFSLVGDRLVGQRVLPDSARGIRHVAIASLAKGVVQIESFSLSIQKALAGG